jgi:CRP/FNR family transcriptional regulator, polysaccharide utilization system transcription regulator
MAATRDVATELSVIERTLIDLQDLQRRSAGDVLFDEGDIGRGVYIIHSGIVDLVYAARNGMTKPLQTAEAGHIVGLSSVVSMRPHDATAVVRVPSELGYVESGRLLHLLERDPAVWLEVLQFLSTDVGSCWDSMRRIAAPH